MIIYVGGLGADYRIASNYSPGVYFFLAIFDQATK